MFMGLATLGLILSFFALLGLSEDFGLLISMLVWFSLWAIYLSFVNVGQIWYSFGWESMLLEVGFLAIFLGPRDIEPSLIV
ncbi:MAG TPA: lipase maturation factor family protein, partial [Myxococcota bacterium]|nr:lipase maturation factor family protein [Myxococcota bacterium]